MRNECNIIRDILPLYAENMVTSDTADFVEEHLKGCEACRREYEQAKEPRPAQEISDAAPLLQLRRKLKAKRIQTAALTAVFVAALLVSIFAVLDAPIYFPYSEGIVTLEELGDKGMLATFDEEVTDFSCRVYEAPDGGEFYYCNIEAWTSLWDKWFSRGKGSLSSTIMVSQGKPIVAVYSPNDGTEDVCLAKYDPNAQNRMEKNVEYEGGITLPRLSSGYYFLFAAGALAFMGILWFLTRKRDELRVWVERIGLYPAAYIVSCCIVSGVDWASYSLPRDFSLTVLISVLLYSGLLLAHNIWRLRREIHATL